MSLTAPEQPTPGQDPQVAPDPTAAATPPAPAAPTPAAPPEPAGSAPWASDLNAVFTDEATRGQVDSFLREKVQPYTTQLEQRAAGNQDAMRLWDNLNSEPVDTYVQITNELYGPEAAQAVLDTLQQALETQGQQEQVPQEGAPPIDPRLQNVIDWAEQEQTSKYYDQQIAAIKADAQYADVNPDLPAFHQFVAASDGDFEQAIAAYRQAAAEFRAGYTPAPEPPPAEVAPNVIGSDGATVPTPPTQPARQTLDEAIADLAHDMQKQAAPPVGPA